MRSSKLPPNHLVRRIGSRWNGRHGTKNGRLLLFWNPLLALQSFHCQQPLWALLASLAILCGSLALSRPTVAAEALAVIRPMSRFTGTEVLNLGNVGLNQVFSASLWVKPTGGGPDWAAIMDYRHSDSKSFAFHQKAGESGHFVFGIHSQNGVLGANVTLRTGEWQHIALVKSARALSIFVNGNQIDQTTVDDSFRIRYTGDELLTLGGRGYGGRMWLGLMSCVAIFASPLTEDEIKTLAAQADCKADAVKQLPTLPN